MVISECIVKYHLNHLQSGLPAKDCKFLPCHNQFHYTALQNYSKIFWDFKIAVSALPVEWYNLYTYCSFFRETIIRLFNEMKKCWKTVLLRTRGNEVRWCWVLKILLSVFNNVLNWPWTAQNQFNITLQLSAEALYYTYM